MESSRLIKRLFQNFLALIAGAAVAILLVLVGDGLYSSLIRSEIEESESPFLLRDRGWYELKKNFQGIEKFGNRRFPVETTNKGVRKQVGADEPSQYDFIFLGDSFTYGVNGPWDETFVGIFSKYTKLKVLNAGVPSYSPTPYLHQYKEIIRNNLANKAHKVIVGLDISDVQDESGYWIDGENHPEKRQAEIDFKLTRSYKAIDYESPLRRIFPNVANAYSFLKYEMLGKFFGRYSNKLDHPRSGFTYLDWKTLNKTFPYENPAGYKPLGVSNGLDRVEKKLMEISRLVKKNNGEMYILIYPWSSQLIHQDKFSFETFVDNVCESAKCSGVINLFPDFKKLIQDDPNWLKKYYHVWDIHFSETGNRVIANKLIRFFSNK